MSGTHRLPGAHRLSGAEHLRSTRGRRNLVAVVMFLASGGVLLTFTWFTSDHWSLSEARTATVVGVVSLGYLAFKMVLSVGYTSVDTAPPTGLRVALIIPTYNEDPAAFAACVRSVLDQTRPVEEIWVVDDASTDLSCFSLAQEMLAGVEGATVTRLRRNGGKRKAQAAALRTSTADVFVTVDSDTVLDPQAVMEGLRPFSSPEVTAVTGNVRVLNWDVNVLTRLTALRYANAFLWERASYSRLRGSVLCCCGSLSFWRADVVRANLDDYLTQTFLGVEVPYGDDRRLTNYALLAGRVVLQDTAIAYTAVPQRWGHYLRQQVRWNKSFFRESLWVLRHASRIRRVWLLSAAEVAMWVAAFVALVGRHSWNLLMHGSVPMYLLWFGAAMAYARSVRYLGSQDVPLRQQLVVFYLAPLYWLMSITLLVPLRFASLLSLKSGAWGTRDAVEVSLAPAAAPAPTPAAPPHAAVPPCPVPAFPRPRTAPALEGAGLPG